MNEEFTVEEFQDRFDELMDRVEDGETFTITSGDSRVVITPVVAELTGLIEKHNQSKIC